MLPVYAANSYCCCWFSLDADPSCSTFVLFLIFFFLLPLLLVLPLSFVLCRYCFSGSSVGTIVVAAIADAAAAAAAATVIISHS